jgi:hypothetical protein
MMSGLLLGMVLSVCTVDSILWLPSPLDLFLLTLVHVHTRVHCLIFNNNNNNNKNNVVVIIIPWHYGVGGGLWPPSRLIPILLFSVSSPTIY